MTESTKDYLDYTDLNKIIDIVKENINMPEYKITDIIEEYINNNSTVKVYPF